MKLYPISLSDFDFIYSEMEKNFIKEEIRDYESAKAVLENPLYTIYRIENDGEFIGFITVWALSDITFAEHFVIFEKYRNCGFGKDAIGILCKMCGRLFLEAEPPETELSARRIGFYKRCGFFENDYPYTQPSYRKGGCGVRLVLLSYPEVLEAPEKKVTELYKTVYNINPKE